MNLEEMFPSFLCIGPWPVSSTATAAIYTSLARPVAAALYAKGRETPITYIAMR